MMFSQVALVNEWQLYVGQKFFVFHNFSFFLSIQNTCALFYEQAVLERLRTLYSRITIASSKSRS